MSYVTDVCDVGIVNNLRSTKLIDDIFMDFLCVWILVFQCKCCRPITRHLSFSKAFVTVCHFKLYNPFYDGLELKEPMIF